MPGKSNKTDKAEHKLIASNRKAHHDYEIGEQFEAGLVLTGSEIKSLRDGHCTLRDGFVQEMGGELWLMQVNIPEYFQSGIYNHTPLRPRKLLMHKKKSLN